MVTESPAAISPTLASPVISQAPSVAPTVVPAPEPYIPPELTPFEEFNFGGYLLMTEEHIDATAAETWEMPLNSFIGESINSVEYGRVTYEKLSDKYYKEYPVTIIERFPRGINTEEEYIDRFFRRKVDFVSADSKIVICSSTLPKEGEGYISFIDTLYEAFSDDELIWSCKMIDGYIPEIIVDLRDENQKSFIDDYFSYRLFETNENFEVYIDQYMFDPLLSPDGKYLAYCGPTWEALTDYPEGSPIYDMPMGFYIKNLETGQTVFYPTEYTDYRILGWVGKAGLDELLGG